MDPIPPAEIDRAAPLVRARGEGAGWRATDYVCRAGPGDRPFEERHASATIAAVRAGSFRYRGEAGTALLHPGALMLGNEGACYECGHDHEGGDRCLAIHVAAEDFAEIAASRAGAARFRFRAAMVPALPAMLPLVAAVEARLAAPDRLAADEAVRHLVAAAIDAGGGGGAPLDLRPSARDQRRIGRALRHLERRAHEKLDLDALAGAAAMSRFHFLRVFRRTTGMTPYRYLVGLRLGRAARRLAATAEPVAAIAFDSGFGDLSTFNAAFRAAFGASPSAFRRRERR